MHDALSQKARHNRFEQLANSDIVKQARKAIQGSELPIKIDPVTGERVETAAKLGPSPNSAPAKFDWTVVETCPLDSSDGSGCTTEVRKEDMKTIHWAKGLGVESIETEDGQTFYPTPSPSAWTYLLIALFPVLGFFIPWGAIRAIGWVGAGFVASAK
jgi:hypothetical protein